MAKGFSPPFQTLIGVRRPSALSGGMTIDDKIIDTPDGPMTWAEWKKKNPVQIPSRRTKGKDLPKKIKRFTGDE
jgi:hypothetical protein